MEEAHRLEQAISKRDEAEKKLEKRIFELVKELEFLMDLKSPISEQKAKEN